MTTKMLKVQFYVPDDMYAALDELGAAWMLSIPMVARKLVFEGINREADAETCLPIEPMVIHRKGSGRRADTALNAAIAAEKGRKQGVVAKEFGVSQAHVSRVWAKVA